MATARTNGGELPASATGGQPKGSVVERVAGLLTDRFLGVSLIDLLKEIDLSALDASQLQLDWLERLGRTVSARGGRGIWKNDGGGRSEAPSGGQATKAITKGVAAVGGAALLKRLALPIALAAAAVAALFLVRRAKSRNKAVSEPAILGTEPYLVGTEAARGEPPPPAPPPGS